MQGIKNLRWENSKNVAINLITEANRALIDQRGCLDKNSKSRYSFNFLKVCYTIVLKQAVRTVRHTSAPAHVRSQAYPLST